MTSVFGPTDPTLSRLAAADGAMLRARHALQAQGAKAQEGSTLDARQLANIDAAANDFEAMFITQMLQPMFETVGTDPLFGGGEGEDTWKGMMVEQYGKEIVKSGGIGLADSVRAAMIQMQEQAQEQGNEA